jgi:hypothetical protein
MNRALQIFVGLMCWWVVGASGGSGPAHLLQAELIANQIDRSHNEYAHQGCFIRWKGEDGATYYENRTDCSDFLDLLLEHTYHFTPAQMKAWTGRERPLATDWFETIRGGNGFEIISEVSSIRPGDVIAVKFPPGGADTGHIMIAAGIPRQRPATAPMEAGTDQWELAIIDSSKSGHGKEDTRRLPDGTFSRGVGEGTLRLYSRSDGTIAGYSWSVFAVSNFAPSTEHKIVVGRLGPRN